MATKLARHFIADEPPAGAVARIARAFRDSGGHLPTVSQMTGVSEARLREFLRQEAGSRVARPRRELM